MQFSFPNCEDLQKNVKFCGGILSIRLGRFVKQSTNVVDIIIRKCNNFNRLKGKKAEIVACFKKVNVFLFV